MCTHADKRTQLPLLRFYCVLGRLASGLSSGPGAGGSRGGVERVAASARGPPSGAPLWPGSVFMSVFKSTEAERETEGKTRRCHCYFPVCRQFVCGPAELLRVGTELLHTSMFPCFSPSRPSDMQNIHRTGNRYVL